MRIVEWGVTVAAFVFSLVVVALMKLRLVSADRAYVWLHPEDWRMPIEGPQHAKRGTHAA